MLAARSFDGAEASQAQVKDMLASRGMKASFFQAEFVDCKLVGSMFDRCTFDLVTVRGGDHGWPRGTPLDATEVIWEFFGQHRR